MPITKNKVKASDPAAKADAEPTVYDKEAEYDETGLPIIDEVDTSKMVAGQAYRLRDKGYRVRVTSTGGLMRF